MMKLARALSIGALTAASLTATTPAAHAVTVPVGVDGCTAESPGAWVYSPCVIVVTSGWYRLTLESSGSAYAEVGCNPSGAAIGPIWTGDGGGSAGDERFLPAGECTMGVAGEFFARARLTKY